MSNLYLLKRKSMVIGFTALFVFSILMFTLSLSGKSFAAAEGTPQPTKRTLSVTGGGMIKATPDIATISLGVMTQDVDAKVAQQNNAKLMSDVISKIKGAGVKSEDIKTINFNIYPNTN